MNLPQQNKKQETLTLVIMLLLLAVVLLVSKFVLGINFSLMEHGSYVAFGYHEIRGGEIWAMSFDSFSGEISSVCEFPDDALHRLLIHSGTGNTSLTMELRYGDEKESYELNSRMLDLTLPEETESFTITVKGSEAVSGYFSAVWE